jgi:tyrosine-protein kinase Etk/Wzc
MKSMDSIDMEKSISLKKVFYRSLEYWKTFLVFISLALVIAFIALNTTTPLYRINTKLLISESRDGGISGGNAENVQAALPGVTLGGPNNFENQTIVLASRKQIEKTLKKLDFEVSYFKTEMFKTQEIYKESPFRVIIDSTVVKPSNLSFKVEFLSKDQFQLTLVENNLEYSEKVSFFQKVNHPLFSITIVPVEKNLPSSGYEQSTYRFEINTMDRLIYNYQKMLVLEKVQFDASIVDIWILENNVDKGVDFLNTLAQAAVDYALERKNQIATNTITFIEKQLIGVADSLGEAENLLEDFRSRHEVMDVSFQGQMIVTQSKELEDQKAALRVRMDYYNYLADYIQNNRNVQDLISPSSMGVDDPVLGQMIGQLSALNAEKSAQQFNSSAENPNVIRIEHSINTLKNSILETLKSVVATTNLSLNDVNNRSFSLTNEIKKLPKTEQMLLGIERRFKMNNDMYTFLLQKRAEAQLAKASNLPDNEIIEEAIVVAQIAPDQNRIILLVILGGFLLPAIIVFLIIFFNDRVLEIDDIKEVTSLPIIGQVPFEIFKGGKALNNDQPNTLLSESFRSIRASMGYYANQKPNKTILVTSSFPGEGKSFCAINLAHSFAQLGKKTILVEFDMRRPSLAKQSGLSNNGLGLSTFYTGESTVEKIIFTDTKIPNFHMIFAGQIPPNPSELIAGSDTNTLVEYLQKEYDVLILDTPPLALVADAHLLTSYADVNVLVVRHNVTPKPLLKINLRDEKVIKIQRLTILLNGIPFQRKEYSYQYGYDLKTKYFAKN